MTTVQVSSRLHRIAEANSPCDGGPELEISDEPAGEEPLRTGLIDLVELILKRRESLERLIRQPALQAQLVPKFLTISLLGFVFFGVALALVFTAAGMWPRLFAIDDVVAGEATRIAAFEQFAPAGRLGRWLDGSAAALIAAYALGLIAASGICLPSLYFYSLLAGVRMSMLDVVVQTLKSKATAAVALVGILPIYAALGLAIVIFPVPASLVEATFWLGLILPFLAGLFGTYSLYRGLAGYADTLPAERRARRATFLQRLVVSWAACYTAVTPVMIHTLWVFLARA
ncbi:MAG TPA: hypothetical protein VFB80_07555 [Pirellulaceae bacterium]|nr:hypothetical protein [Pirellulaceae bacterium]